MGAAIRMIVKIIIFLLAFTCFTLIFVPVHQHLRHAGRIVEYMVVGSSFVTVLLLPLGMVPRSLAPLLVLFMSISIGVATKVWDAPEIANDLRVDGQVGLVTGATRGVGFGVAADLVKRGASAVIVTSRSKKRADTAARSLCANCVGEVVNLMQLQSVYDLVSRISVPLNFVVLNAFDYSCGGIRTDGYENCAFTQVLANHVLIRELVEAKKLSVGARIVAVTSGAYLDYARGVRELTNLSYREENTTPSRLFFGTYEKVKGSQISWIKAWAKRHPKYTFVSANPGPIIAPSNSPDVMTQFLVDEGFESGLAKFFAKPLLSLGRYIGYRSVSVAIRDIVRGVVDGDVESGTLLSTGVRNDVGVFGSESAINGIWTSTETATAVITTNINQRRVNQQQQRS